MFTTKLFSFSKPTNSTKQPTGDGRSVPCKMVEPCGVVNPILVFNFGVSENPSSYNYAYISEFSRFYWIEEWTWSKGLWRAACRVDVLASWRSQIRSSSEYVLRSASEVSPSVVDTYYPAVNSFSYVNSVFQPWNARTLSSGSYVIGLLGGSDGDTTGGVTYYIASQTLLNQFMNGIMSEPGWMGVPAEISEELMKCLVNPLQYVTSVMWFPIDPNEWASSAVVPYVGWWKPDVALLALTSAFTAEGSAGTRGSHPQAGSNRTYLNYSPYTRLSVQIPPFGTVALNPDQFPPGSEIHYEIVVDGVSGEGKLKLYSQGNANAPIVMASRVGVQLSVGQSTNPIENTGGSILSSAGGMLEGFSNALDKAVGKVFSGVGNTLSYLNPQFSNVTYAGGVSSYIDSGRLIQEFVRTTETDNEHLGSPVCKKMSLASLSGYTMVLDPDIDIPATAEEKSQISSFMSSGFYIE